YRDAIMRADAAIPDSGLMVLVWAILKRQKLGRISGLTYLQRLLQLRSFQGIGQSFFVLPSAESKRKLLGWASAERRPLTSDDCYVAPRYHLAVSDPQLLNLVRSRQPTHIVI